MSIKEREVAFSFECVDPWRCHGSGKQEPFKGIRELGFTERGGFVVDAWTTPFVAPGEARGEYVTSIAISPLDYRRKYATETGFLRRRDSLTIFSDYGTPHVIRAPTEILDTLTGECVAQGLPNRAPAPGDENGGGT